MISDLVAGTYVRSDYPVTSYIVEALHLDKVVVPILGTPILMCKSGYGYFVHHQNREILRAFVL